MIIEKNLTNHSASSLEDAEVPCGRINTKALGQVPFMVKEFSKDEFIYNLGQVSDCIYFIEEGSVKIAKKDYSGKEIVQSILSAGNVLGEKALSKEEIRSEYAQVITSNATIRAFIVEDVLEESQRNSELAHEVINIMIQKLESLERRLESITSKDSRTRVVDFLKDLARETGKKVGYETLIKNNFTHKDIASLTGTSRQTVTTTLNNLKEKNIINFDRRRILIRDIDLLI